MWQRLLEYITVYFNNRQIAGPAVYQPRHATKWPIRSLLSHIMHVCDNYEGDNVMISIIMMFQCLKLQNFKKNIFIF